ncbi:hypothetical protein ABT009_04190 [Streptomyces sp. NPDC002896]|uniref:hypothetical protein n=1 Tax=Streptomyces sp. NPDC002896 TaxID=3154438 RepID=UPI00332DC122
MSRKSSKDPKEPRPGARARERARSQQEPGAHSGAESGPVSAAVMRWSPAVPAASARSSPGAWRQPARP